METSPRVGGRVSFRVYCRKPTTLWKRWKLFNCNAPWVWNFFCRKPTTLWKRWKPVLSEDHVDEPEVNVGNPLLSERDGNRASGVTCEPCQTTKSETHYSLKEMETELLTLTTLPDGGIGRKPTTLWKRWKLLFIALWEPLSVLSRKPTTLWKRWKHTVFMCIKHTNTSCRKPTTLWKRWKQTCFFVPFYCDPRTSETHYSLKEMETNNVTFDGPLDLWIVGNPLLSERDGN